MYISNEGLLVILFVGLVAGWLAGKVVRGTGFGIIGDIVVGIAGALVASFLFPKLGIHIGTGLISEIVYFAPLPRLGRGVLSAIKSRKDCEIPDLRIRPSGVDVAWRGLD